MDFRHPIQAVIPGAQGRILSVLAGTSAELNLRTIARLAGVSLAQASRLLPGLVELGVVERREVPPSALFRFVPEHVASRALTGLASARQTVLEEMRRSAARLGPRAASVVVFGSFARGEADAASDIDVVVVRAAGIDEDDQAWRAAVDRWQDGIRRLSGNRMELVEVGEADVARLLRSRKPLWLEVQRDGIAVSGAPLAKLRGRRSA